MHSVLQDIRYAFRNLAKSPGFTAVALASLALGIGANTAMFSITDQVLLRLLPVRHARELLYFKTGGGNQGMVNGPDAFSHPMYLDLAAHRDLLADLAGRFPVPLSLAWRERSDRVNGEIVTGTYFDTLGLSVVLGRPITPDDDRTPGAHPVVVLTHRYWRTRFGANPAILNQTITINAHPMTVIGVAAPGYDGFSVGDKADVLIPAMMKAQLTPNWNGLGNRRIMWLQLVGRLQPGIPREQAEVRLRAAYRAILREELKSIPTPSPRLAKAFSTKPLDLVPGMRGNSQLRTEFTTPLVMLSGMVGLLLLIACANVANLLLARAAGRRKEIAVRLALGAGRSRLVRQLLVESAVVSFLGGALGLLVAAWTGWWLSRFVPESAAAIFEAPLDPRVLAFTAGLSLVTGVVFGLVPALQATSPSLAGTLKDQAGSISPGTAHIRLRKGLVVAQVALSLVLLTGAGLFARSLANLRNTDLGFRRDRLVLFTVDPGLNGYSETRVRRFALDLQQRIGAIPGIRSVGLGENLVIDDNQSMSTIRIVGREPKDGDDMNPNFDAVSPAYFATLGQALLLGREFTAADGPAAPRVAIVNDSFARYYFPSETPLGRRFTLRRDNAPIEIVGVVKDAKYSRVREDATRVVYLPYQQKPAPDQIVVYALTPSDPKAIFNTLRREVARMDPALPVAGMRTMEQHVDRALGGERLIAALAVAFGGLATLLAAIGLYGVMAYTVSRRTREIGIRMALGAGRRSLLSMVLRDVAALTAVGIAIAIPAALWLAGLVRELLFGILPADPIALAGATAVLAAAAFLAGWFPARRATRIDPIAALRYE